MTIPMRVWRVEAQPDGGSRGVFVTATGKGSGGDTAELTWWSLPEAAPRVGDRMTVTIEPEGGGKC